MAVPVGPATALRVRPAYLQPVQVAVFETGERYGTHRSFLVLFRIAHPGHAVAPLLVHDLADGADELLLIVEGDESLVGF